MRIRSLTPALISLLAAGALGLSACGGDDDSSSSDGSGGGETVASEIDLEVVAVDGIKWEKDEYTATAGTVTSALRNSSSLPHNLHFIDETGKENLVVLDAPSRGDVDIDDVELAAGTYTLICTIPGHSNMKATLTVN
jgi:plastocyanin